MTRITAHDVTSAPDESRERLERIGARVGKVLNIFGGMASSPVLLELYEQTETLLAEKSSLDSRTRAAIHLTVANVNDCGYCQSAYTGEVMANGFTADDAVDIRRGKVGDERLDALLAVARDIAAERGEVDDGTWTAALAAGWSERELLDAFADVIRTTLTNWFNHLAGTELDLRPVPEL